LWARGRNVMKGYTAIRIDRGALTPDGWLRTGDLGGARPTATSTSSGA
jgi:long-subunit acyl-CoA synthetase (AMP-forming)